MKRLIRNIKNGYYNMSLKAKLILLYTLAFVLSLFILGWFSYKYTSAILEDQVNKTLAEVFTQIYINLTSILTEAVNVSDQIYKDQNIQKVLDKYYCNDYGIPYYEQYQDYRTIIYFLRSIEENPNVLKIKLYLKSNAFFINEKDNIFPLTSPQGMYYYDLFNRISTDKLWLSTHKVSDAMGREHSAISLVRLLKNFKNLNEQAGIIVIDINEEQIGNMLKNINITNDTIVFLVDNDRIILSHNNDQSQIGQKLSNELLEQLYTRHNNSIFFRIQYHGKEYLTLSKDIPLNGWKLIGMIPLKQVSYKSDSIRTFTIIMIIISCAIVVFLAIVISNNIYRNINILVRKMHNIASFPVEKEVIYHDEIGELEDDFIQMVHTLKTLMKENYEVKLAKQETEYRALRAQINPHFLYNTLDCINWMALAMKASNISNAIMLLSKFLRYGLSKEDVSYIKDEIEYIKIYVDIQNIRFDDKIKVHYDIEDKALYQRIPKLTLQPIVENAIIHGIQPKPESMGNIFISCRVDNEVVLITIKDDGIGIPDEKIDGLLNNSNDNSGSYGLRNVNDRIKFNYGQDYGLEVSNVNTGGTCVSIKLPYIS